MNASLLLFVAALGIDPQIETEHRVYASPAVFEALAQGRSPPATYTYDEDPAGKPASIPPQGYPVDPLAGGAPCGACIDPGYSFGPVGPQPYKFGWTTRGDVGFIPKTSVDAGMGQLSIFEVNAAWRYTTGWPPSIPNWIFSWTPEFNFRGWDGPNSPDLPGRAFRFASDFELATPGNNPWSFQLGFTPALVTDFNSSINSDAFNWDGRGVLFFRPNQQLMLAAGAAYLDRVHDRVIPYAGVVWTPNQQWEWRLMFPKSRVSVFLGNWWGEAKWLYAGVEYNVEAYQIGTTPPGGGDNEKVQFTDYRATLGLRGEGGGVSSFGEVGWVFAREVDFLHGTSGFDIAPNLLVRAGLRF